MSASAVTCFFSAVTTVAWNAANMVALRCVLVGGAVEGLWFVVGGAVGLVGAVITALSKSTRV